MLTSLIIIFFTGILFAILAIPLIKRKIKINHWYGIRLPQTMQNESIWLDVNSIIGKYIFLFGIITSILSLYFILYPIEPAFLMIYILLTILIFGSVLLVVLSYKVANKISLSYFNKK